MSKTKRKIGTKKKEEKSVQQTKIEAKNEKKEKNQLEEAVKLFAERVTVAGVEDLYKSKIKLERWMWYVTMLGVCLGVVLKCHSKINEYINPRAVYNYYPIANSMPPFPNLSICGPMSVDKKKFKEFLIIPPKTQNLIKRKNLDINEIIDFTLDFWRYDRLPVDIENPMIAQASLQIMDATTVQFPRGFVDLFLAIYPTCPESLSSCTFYGQEIDCCQIAQFTFTQDSICYYFDLTHISTASTNNGRPDEPSHLSDNGLSIKFRFNQPSVYQGVMQNGFLIAIDYLWMAAIPVAVPAGSDALISLSATKKEKLTDCQPNKQIRLKYFSDYAPTDAMVNSEIFVRSFYTFLGCDWAVLTYQPKLNHTLPICQPIFLYVFKTALTSKNQYNVEKLDQDFAKSAAWQGEKHYELCNEWIYKIISASYGYVYDQQGQEVEENPDITEETWQWSRIRIFFPTASYLFIKEEPASPFYVAMCNIGGSICMYCGVSMISFVQLIIYGSFLFSVIVWKLWKKKRNKNKVAPAV